MQQTIPWLKIQALEEEIKALKSLTNKGKAKKIETKGLEGFLKGVNVSEKEIKQAKKSFFTFNSQ